MIYTKTDNPNIIKQTETVDSEIYIDKLEKQISDLETQINNAPVQIETSKTYPKEINDLIEQHNEMIDTGVETELAEKQSLLSELTKL